MIDLAPHRLVGSFPPLITPFVDGDVDYDTYARLIHWHVREGSHGVVVTGTTGEPSTLTLDERSRLVATAVEAAAGRIEVVAATGTESLPATLELSRRAVDAGASALLVVTPYYSKPPQRALVDYFDAVGQMTELPLLMYHIPGRTGINVDPDTVADIADRIDSFVGVKHSAYDLLWLTEVLASTPDGFRVFVGVEELSFPMLAVGATGLVNAAANVAPARIAHLYDLVRVGDLAAARAEHFALFKLNQAVFWDTNPIAVKFLMRHLGHIENNDHRLPMVPATAQLERRLVALAHDLALVPTQC